MPRARRMSHLQGNSTTHKQGMLCLITLRTHTGMAAQNSYSDCNGVLAVLCAVKLKATFDLRISAWNGAYPANAVGLAALSTMSLRRILPQTLEPWDGLQRMSLNVLQTTWAWILCWSGRYLRMLVSRPSGRSMRQALEGSD